MFMFNAHGLIYGKGILLLWPWSVLFLLRKKAENRAEFLHAMPFAINTKINRNRNEKCDIIYCRTARSDGSHYDKVFPVRVQ